MAITATGKTCDSGDGDATTSTTVSGAISSPTAGNFLIFGISWDCGAGGTISCSSVSDGVNFASSLPTEEYVPFHQRQQLWYFPNIRSGISTITATFSTATGFRRIIGAEFSGVATSSLTDGATGSEQTSVPTSANAVTSTTFARAGTNDVLIGFVGFYNGNPSSLTAGTGFTKIIDDSAAPNIPLGLEYQVYSTSGVTAATWTIGSSVDTSSSAAAFLAATTTSKTISSTTNVVTSAKKAVSFKRGPIATNTIGSLTKTKSVAGSLLSTIVNIPGPTISVQINKVISDVINIIGSLARSYSLIKQTTANVIGKLNETRFQTVTTNVVNVAASIPRIISMTKTSSVVSVIDTIRNNASKTVVTSIVNVITTIRRTITVLRPSPTPVNVIGTITHPAISRRITNETNVGVTFIRLLPKRITTSTVNVVDSIHNGQLALTFSTSINVVTSFVKQTGEKISGIVNVIGVLTFIKAFPKALSANIQINSLINVAINKPAFTVITNVIDTLRNSLQKSITALTIRVNVNLLKTKLFIFTTAVVNVLLPNNFIIVRSKSLAMITNATTTLRKSVNSTKSAITTVIGTIAKRINRIAPTLTALANVADSLQLASTKTLNVAVNVISSMRGSHANKILTTTVNVLAANLLKTAKKIITTGTVNVIETMSQVKFVSKNIITGNINVPSTLKIIPVQFLTAIVRVLVAQQQRAITKTITNSNVRGIDTITSKRNVVKPLTTTINVITTALAFGYFRTLTAVIRALESLVSVIHYDPHRTLIVDDSMMNVPTIINEMITRVNSYGVLNMTGTSCDTCVLTNLTEANGYCPVFAGTTPTYSGQLVSTINGVDTPIGSSALTALTLTLRDTISGSIVNGVNAVDILNTGRGSVDVDGNILIAFLPGDTALFNANNTTEERSMLIEFTFNGGMKIGAKEVLFSITQAE